MTLDDAGFASVVELVRRIRYLIQYLELSNICRVFSRLFQATSTSKVHFASKDNRLFPGTSLRIESDLHYFLGYTQNLMPSLALAASF